MAFWFTCFYLQVICASLGRGRHITLPEPVKINLRHLQPVDLNRLSPRCVYWDYLTNDWASDGCSVVASNSTHTRCQCDHLTNFALLMRKDASNGAGIHIRLDIVASVVAAVVVLGILAALLKVRNNFKYPLSSLSSLHKDNLIKKMFEALISRKNFAL